MCVRKTLERLLFFITVFSAAVLGQSAVVRDDVPALPTPATSSVDAPQFPRWVRYSGKVQLDPGRAQVALTFSIYKDRTASNALWQETQNVHPDANGDYSVLLGAGDPNGLPAGFFSSTEAQWLGIRVTGQAEGDRVPFFAVPYAMTAFSAQSLQGFSANDFVLRSELPGLIEQLKQQSNGGAAGSQQFQAASTFNGLINEIPAYHIEDSIPSQLGDLVQDGSGYALRAFSATNSAIYAATRSTTTASNTIYSANFAPGGRGLRAESLAITGNGIGVWGVTQGADGATGVLGEAPKPTGFTFGVRGKNASENGIGVFGFSSSLTGVTTGVRGETRSPAGSAGVFDAFNGGNILSGRSAGVETFSVDSLGDVAAAGAVSAPSFTGTFRGIGSGLTGVNADTLGGLAPSDFVKAGALSTTGVQNLASQQLQINPDPVSNQFGFAGFIRDDLDTVHSYIGQAGSQLHFRLSRSVPDEAGIKDFLIAPYNFGMAIEYAGTIEVWSKNFSVHTNNSKVLPVTGAQFWVGDQLDLGGLFVTANVNSFTDTGNVIIAADRFTHASHGSMNFVTRNLEDSFRFQNGQLGQETMFGQVFKTLSTSNIEAYNGPVTAAIVANNDASAVQLGSRSASRVDIITADAAPQVSVFPSGNVSIGSTTETAKLAVGSSGQFQVSGAGAVTIGGGTPIVQHISATAGLSVAALAPASCQVVTVAAAGANDGDSVALGVPNALAASGDLMLFGWVSGPDIVSVRTCNMGSAPVDASGTVRVDVWKH